MQDLSAAICKHTIQKGAATDPGVHYWGQEQVI